MNWAWAGAAISVFGNVSSTSGMLGADLGPENPGERGIGPSVRALQLLVSALWNNTKAGLPVGASFFSNNFGENAR